MWASIESRLSRTAAIPPCAQPEAESSRVRLLTKRNPAMLCQAKGRGLAGQAAADDQDIEILHGCSLSGCFLERI
jgi:hypothetical protein